MAQRTSTPDLAAPSTSPPVAGTECGPKAQAHGYRCYSPKALQTAYGLNPLLAKGVDGHGETIVLPETTYLASQKRQLGHQGIFLRQSLAAYDHRFGLPPVHLRLDTTLAPGSLTNEVAGIEELIDVETAHAMAPDATIDVEFVRINREGSFLPELPEIIRHAARVGQVLSMSFGTGETCLDHELPAIERALAAAAAKHLSMFASAGDEDDVSRPCNLSPGSNGVRGVSLPAADPLVTAVGGTTLLANPATGRYENETVWNQQEASGGSVPFGTGGGFSTVFPRPAYQNGVPGIGAYRGVPDVAYDASVTDGVEIEEYAQGAKLCQSLRHPNPYGNALTSARSHVLSPGRRDCVALTRLGGTSIGAPAWAGIAALADQVARRPLGPLNPTIYRIGESPLYHDAFHDVTTGNNTATYMGKLIPGYSAGPGWDPVTGWGSPNAATLVPLLAQGG